MNPQETDIDWSWANDRDSLPIYSAVALSLGYEIETLAPVGQRWKNQPYIEPPEDYKSRVAATWEAVGNKKISCLRTSQLGVAFSPDAKFEDAQLWEIDLVEFRHYCDSRKWTVPSQFLPNGYSPVESKLTQSAVSTERAAGSTGPKRRRDLLAPVIEQAQRRCGNLYDAPAVWAVLVQFAESKIGPLLEVTEDGIKWRDANDNVKFLSINNLRDRITRKQRANPR